MNYRIIITNLVVFSIGLTLFMYEITLTRLFSSLMWYHFVFIVISLAMLGWTIGGVYAFGWLKRRKNLTKSQMDEHTSKLKVKILILLSIILWVAILFLYKTPYSDYLLPIYIILSTLPFVLGGYYLSLVFKENASRSNTLYFADLFGSALGSVLIVLLLDSFSLIRIGFILALIPLLAATFYLSVRKYQLPSILAVTIILVLTISSGNIFDNWAQDFGALKGNPKLLSSLSQPRIVYTAWNSLARTDVVEESSNENKTVLVDGGAASDMVFFNGDLKTIDYLKSDVGYFPFTYKKNNSALLIGPGGGKDILYAHLGGIKSITAVEINPGSVEAAKIFKDFNGNIYGQDVTKVYVQDGRSFITRDQNKYDVIFLSKVMTQASETLGYALSENYIYTKEAYEAYLNRLNPDGTLAFVLHSKSYLGKATATLIQIFEDRGIPREEAVKYMTVVNSTYIDGQMHDHGNQIMYPLLMVKNTPFTAEQSQRIFSLAQQYKQQIVSLPNNYERLNAITPPAYQQSSYLVTDDYPFFYNPGHQAPLLILMMLLAVFIGGYLLMRRPLAIKDKWLRYFRNYFAYLGIAFMLIEIALIQKLILLFGHPTLTFSAVIAILLFTAGLGSFFSKYVTNKIPLKIIGAAVFTYSVLLYFALPWFIFTFQGAETTVKILATFVLLLPQGVLMGIPFPTGIRQIEILKKDELIPVFWAMNGWMSVAGSILALVIAMFFGYTVTLLAGALTYLIFAFHTNNFSKI